MKKEEKEGEISAFISSKRQQLYYETDASSCHCCQQATADGGGVVGVCALAQIAVASDRLSKHEGKAQSLWKTTGSRTESDRESCKNE